MEASLGALLGSVDDRIGVLALGIEENLALRVFRVPLKSQLREG